MSVTPIIAPDDDLGEIGRCQACGSPVHSYTCNSAVIAVRPEAAREDYWAACTRPSCENAWGEGYLQGWPDWLVDDEGNPKP